MRALRNLQRRLNKNKIVLDWSSAGSNKHPCNSVWSHQTIQCNRLKNEESHVSPTNNDNGGKYKFSAIVFPTKLLLLYSVGHKSLDKNAFKSQIFLFSPLFLYYKQIVVYNVKTCVLLTCTRGSQWATVLRFSPVVTDLGLPDWGRSATDPICSNLLFKLWIACRDGGTLSGKRSTNKSTTSLYKNTLFRW
jgi:hypothetical protein